ncbi:FAD/NAD-P-binding domain-containing protein [Sanghuangporus baumii]|uniref:FAD/NAD-P-binding domain-containing protein n=1 Tax=Sanghuangporus baumii TaxID=108892 RepID=A0A9Q5N7V6_SANBA|nr:FAD/NAD-P-binding domain-containing protein [Sanghuangporus baumii]
MDKPSCWAIHSKKELPIYTHNRVAIIGDAVHAVSPHQGAGAGTAIEDGYILDALLAHSRTTLSTLPVAFKAYESICLRHANQFQASETDVGDDNLKLVAFGETFLGNNRWAWETVADDNLVETTSLLKAGTPFETQ